VGTFIFKLGAAPVLVGIASLASRRWGQAIGGWLVALPVTAGPVVFFLALERGSQFASVAAAGCLAGAAGECAFCLGYVWSARRSSWPQALLAGALCFALLAALLPGLHAGIIPLFLVAIGVTGVSLCLVPRGRISRPVVTQSRWDVPIRMVAATAAILLLTATAPLLGPTLSGILAAFPIYASTLTVFAHRSEGSEAAAQVLRGLLYGLFAYGAFFLSVSLLILRSTLVITFLISAIVALAVQGGSLWTIRRENSTCTED
jgi:hypothetical protein